MMSEYIPPNLVTAPKMRWKLRSVLYDGGPNDDQHPGWSAAVGTFDKDPETVVIRWNGSSENPLGTPQSRSAPTWFVLPRELRSVVKSWIEKEMGAKD